MGPSRLPWVLARTGAFGEGDVVGLDRDEARHLSAVLRSRAGDPVIVADGHGAVADGVIRTLGRSAAEVEICEVRHEARPSGLELTVALAVLHGQAMDWAVQKAVEVGVRTLWPVCSSRSQLSVDRARGRAVHWRRVARQSLKQCHRAWSMDVPDPVSLTDLVESRSESPGLVADQGGVAPRQLAPERGDILLVGPEGGFSSAEMALLDGHGWARVCLGRHILRAETAAVVGAAILITQA